MTFKLPGKSIQIGTSGYKSALKSASPAKHPKGGKEHKHLFQKLHPKGKKFWDTKLGEGISNVKEKYVKNKTDKKISKSEDGETKVPGTGGIGKNKKPLIVHESSSGSGVTKPASRESTSYHSKGGKGETFVRGGGDPYQYRSMDGGENFQYKNIGEQGWNDVKGGYDKISKSYQEANSSPAKHYKGDHKGAKKHPTHKLSQVTDFLDEVAYPIKRVVYHEHNKTERNNR